MLNIFSRPTIKGTLVAGGTKTSVKIKKITATDAFILLYAITKQLAKSLKLDHRYVLNKLLEIDTKANRIVKQEARAVNKQMQKQKHLSKKS